MTVVTPPTTTTTPPPAQSETKRHAAISAQRLEELQTKPAPQRRPVQTRAAAGRNRGLSKLSRGGENREVLGGGREALLVCVQQVGHLNPADRPDLLPPAEKHKGFHRMHVRGKTISESEGAARCEASAGPALQMSVCLPFSQQSQQLT